MMMTKWDETPTWRINRFLTSSLRAESIVPPVESYITDLDGNEDFELPFMIPGFEVPEIKTIYDGGAFKNLPYCIYSSSMSRVGDDIYMLCGQVTYSFYSGNTNMLFAISNYCNELLRRQDWSAADINAFYTLDATYPFDFKCIGFMTSAGPTDLQDESGRSQFMIVIKYEATWEGTGRVDQVIPNSGGLGMR